MERYLKTTLVFFLAIFCLAVGLNNVIDYDVNFQFVRHILAMDTMHPWFNTDIAIKRSINSPSLQAFFYHLIIATELLAGLLALIASIFMLKNIKHDHHFSKSKNIFLIAAGLMLALWYFGFNVIASNWFYMWANQYNASPTAYDFIIFIMITVLYIMRDEKLVKV